LISLSLRSRHGRAIKKEGSEGFFFLSISKTLKRILEFWRWMFLFYDLGFTFWNQFWSGFLSLFF
jgi:hypothetical protein